MLHTIQVLTVAIFDHILGVLNISEGFVAAHHLDHDGGHIWLRSVMLHIIQTMTTFDQM